MLGDRWRMAGVSTRKTTYTEVFASREFRALLGNNVLMVLSETMQMLALSVLVYDATRSPFLASFAYTAGFLPEVVGGAFLLSVADRLPPRFAIVAGAGVRVAKLVLIAAVPMPAPMMLAVVLVLSVTRPVFTAAASGLLPEVLDGDRYVLGRSLFTVAISVAQIASLGAGGALLAWLQPREVFYAAAALALLGGLWSLAGLVPRPPRSGRTEHGVLTESLRRNARLLADRGVRRLLLAFWLPVSLLTGAESLAVPYAADRGFAPNTGGVLLMALPFGMLAGDLVVGRFCAPATRERATLPLAMLVGVALVPLALPMSMWLAFTLFLLAAVGLAYELGLQRAFVDAVPETVRAQGFGLLSSGLMAGQGVGSLLAGGVAEAIGPGPALTACGLAVLVAAFVTIRGWNEL